MHSFTLRHMNVRVVQSHKASELSSSTMYPKNIVEMPKRINNPIFIYNHILSCDYTYTNTTLLCDSQLVFTQKSVFF